VGCVVSRALPGADMSEGIVHSATERRFPFGQNWSQFLKEIDDNRIEQAEESLRQMLKMKTLRGRSFLDIGSGSGVFSLAALRLGARVHSFDYDVHSVACTRELKRRYCANDTDWTIEVGSVLDKAYLHSLGKFDIVYSWGVLHHTGAMWQALDNVLTQVAAGGQLFIAIYNDQGRTSVYWNKVKRVYNRLPKTLKFLILWPAFIRLWGPTILRDVIIRGRALHTWKNYSSCRGMSPWRDVVDWVGGYPFEVAKPEQVFEFCRDRGFTLITLKTCGGGLACNEYIFARAGTEGCS
jgi:2-polyprenyl-3-methyl-5-hydroxy-6-metoxy-1,4-benzoquinol methylase